MNKEIEKEFEWIKETGWYSHLQSMGQRSLEEFLGAIEHRYISRQSLSEELEKMKKPETKIGRTTREKLYMGYNKAITDLKQKFGV